MSNAESNESSGKEWELDENVKEELDGVMSEEGVVGMFQNAQSGEERIPLIKEFTPDENEWGGKSIFREGQPRSLTLADNMAEAFPVIKPSEEFLHKFIEDYEMRLTSLEGISREQLERIFRAMFGAGPADSTEGRSDLSIALSAGPEDSE